MRILKQLTSVADPHLLLCGSGSGNPKMFIRIRIQGGKQEEKSNQHFGTKSFKITSTLKINELNITLSVTKVSLLLIFHFCIHLMNLYIF